MSSPVLPLSNTKQLTPKSLVKTSPQTRRTGPYARARANSADGREGALQAPGVTIQSSKHRRGRDMITEEQKQQLIAKGYVIENMTESNGPG